jgi:hypothetical protein
MQVPFHVPLFCLYERTSTAQSFYKSACLLLLPVLKSTTERAKRLRFAPFIGVLPTRTAHCFIVYLLSFFTFLWISSNGFDGSILSLSVDASHSRFEFEYNGSDTSRIYVPDTGSLLPSGIRVNLNDINA